MMAVDIVRPVLAGPALARGRLLTVQTCKGALEVRAPARFLGALVRWCDGSHTVSQLDAVSFAEWGDTSFPAFVRSMLQSGVLVDVLAACLTRSSASGADLERSWTDLLARASALLVVTVGRGSLASTDEPIPASAMLLQIGALANAGADWALHRDLGWAGDVGCDEACLLEACGIADEMLLHVAALGASPWPGSEHWPQISWAELPQHRGLLIAKAVPDKSAPEREVGIVAWGRSEDPEQALRKALGEYAERRALRQAAATVDAALSEMPHALLPEVFVRYSRRQCTDKALAIKRFDATQSHRWTKGRELTTNAEVWLPADCVYGRRALDSRPDEPVHARMTSSGCASHEDLACAIERAACEVIERDAFARHWLKQRACTRVDQRTLPRPLQKRIQALRASGCETFVLLTSEGLGPSILVIVRNAQRGFACLGGASGTSAENTIEAAFIEAEFAAIARNAFRGRTPSLPSKRVSTPQQHSDLYATRRHFRRADVLIGPEESAIPWGSIAWPGSWRTRLQRGADILPAYWVDLTGDDPPCQLDGVPIRTVRVLIPGCIPLAFGYGALPEAMVSHRITAAARFPHPFA